MPMAGASQDVVACFANTGKEMPQTLDFVRDCGERWNVPIVWLEYAPAGEKQRKFRVVDHATRQPERRAVRSAARASGSTCPTRSRRFCTTMLKIRVMRDYARSLGWEHWTNAVGLRADEARRVARTQESARAVGDHRPACTTPA